VTCLQWAGKGRKEKKRSQWSTKRKRGRRHWVLNQEKGLGGVIEYRPVRARRRVRVKEEKKEGGDETTGRLIAFATSPKREKKPPYQSLRQIGKFG